MAPRLRRSDCSEPGLTRRRRGRGFVYLDERGAQIKDPDTILRLGELAIPPAWKDVWICPDPWGHLQATGIDAAGRKQYLYHQRWRERRDREKFARMVRFARALPPLRRRVAKDIAGEEVTRERVLAGSVRLLDIGLFRVGSEEYAADEHGVGLATVRKDHVSVNGERFVFDYPAKGGTRRVHVITDPLSHDLLSTLKRRRGGGDELLTYRNGRHWYPVRSDDVNDYLKRQTGADFTAKDFRTWNATVLASVSLATSGTDATSRTARKRAINNAAKGVAEILGNTPAVARRSYIDPRVFDRYLSGWTIAGALSRLGDLDPADDAGRAKLEGAVLDLLDDEEDSPALQQFAEPAEVV